MRTLDQADVLSVRDRQLLASIKALIYQYEPEATVLLYGSVARGTHTPESDYDILILTDTELSRERQREICNTVTDWEIDVSGIAVSLLFDVKGEWSRPREWIPPFHREVQRDSIVL